MTFLSEALRDHTERRWYRERPDPHRGRRGGGLNLQQASYVFHFDRWWSPATERQAEDRAHRIGPVYRHLCAETIEGRIDAVLRRKQDLCDELVDDVSLYLGRHLAPREIFGLFGLEAPPGTSDPSSP